MSLHVEEPVRRFAERSDAFPTPPPCDGVIVALDDPTRVYGSTIRENPLAVGWTLPEHLPGDRRVIFSGTLSEELFEAHPQTWLQAGRAALDGLCERLAPSLLQARRSVCFLPHSRHVLSDAASCLKFLADHEAEPFEIVLSPASLIEPSMVEAVDDHLTRAFEVLGGRCAMLALGDFNVSADGKSCEPAPLGRGRMPREHVLRLIEAHVPPSTPIVLCSAAIDQQLAWLAP